MVWGHFCPDQPPPSPASNRVKDFQMGWGININRYIVDAVFGFIQTLSKHQGLFFFFKLFLKHPIVKQIVQCFSRCFRFQKVHSESEPNKQVKTQNLLGFSIFSLIYKFVMIFFAMPVFLSTCYKKKHCRHN